MIAFTNIQIITKTQVILKGYLVIEANKIKALGEGILPERWSNYQEYSLPNFKIMPGFIDCHTHGGYGVAFEDNTFEAFHHYATKITQEGVTRFCQGTVTESIDSLIIMLKKFSEWDTTTDHDDEALSLGVHLEGPFINANHKGAHPVELLKKPEFKTIQKLIKASQNKIKIITMAPELVKDEAIWELLTTNRILVSAGHSDLNWKQFDDQNLIKHIYHVSHLFNGMSGMAAREPGLAAISLYYPQILTEVIADTHHINPYILKTIYKIKGRSGICLITDSMRAKGMPDGKYMLGELKAVKKNNEVRLELNNSLAGSVVKFDECYRNFKHINQMTDQQMIDVSSYNIAQQLKIKGVSGDIFVNATADLVILDKTDHVMYTIVNGKIVYKNKKLKQDH